MTPEGRIKKRIKLLLDNYPNLYRYMPVPSGFGSATLDYLICVHGKFLAIEAKAPGKQLTLRQQETARRIREAGGTVLVIEDDLGLEELRVFLEE
jgi:hypothetical protein